MEQLLTMADVTKSLAVCDDTIAKEIKAGRLQAIKIGRQWRFTQDQFNEYLRSRTTAKKQKS